MINKEKIRRGAECCKYKPSANGCPEECPYLPKGHLTCGLDPFLDDVIMLLKEQKPVKPKLVGVNTWTCGECGALLGWEEYSCPECGRTVRWNE